MVQSLSKTTDFKEGSVQRLQREIAEMEAVLERGIRDLRRFENEIHARLNREIARIRELSDLYKQQKKAKKAKRLEQKKKGKNYREPRQVTLPDKAKEEKGTISLTQQQELRRVYKEAVLQVHPDKIHHEGENDKILKATDLTARLNGIYKRGDLEELINFYQFIISENGLYEKGIPAKEIAVDPQARLVSLKKKKEAMSLELEKLKNSYTYKILTTYEDPLSFIDELQLQFRERILQLEKRTRKG
jgi:hypothetical protein